MKNLKQQSQDFYIQLGAKVRDVRCRAKISQEKLADHLGITFQQVQKYEKGTNRIPLFKLKMVCELCKVPFSHFLADEEGCEAPVLTVADGEMMDLLASLGRNQKKMVKEMIRNLKPEGE
jgi:transcriptional regulator with XRE-family HTH domain